MVSNFKIPAPIVLLSKWTFVIGTTSIIAFVMLACAPVEHTVSFDRKFEVNAFQHLKSIPVEDGHYYQAGISEHFLYLVHDSDPLRIIVLNNQLESQDTATVVFDALTCSIPEKPLIHIDSPFFYVTDRLSSCVWKGDLNTWRAQALISNVPPVMQSVCVGKNTFAMHLLMGKGLNPVMENVLALVSRRTPLVSLHHELLEEQMDGLYSTDGLLRYSRLLHQVIYIYFFRNEYVVMDTSLQLLARRHTIDTVSIADIHPVQLSRTSYSMTAPPLVVNQMARVINKHLFIHSLIRAGNEDDSANDSAIIDVYDLTKAHYVSSFYIPDAQSLRNFFIYGNKLVVAYDDRLDGYKLKKYVDQL